MPGIDMGEHGYHRGDTKRRQLVRMRGVVGREIDHEPSLDRRSDQPPVVDSDGITAA
jgi:hypothetical protein